MSRFLYELIGLGAGVMFILALKGLSHQELQGEEIFLEQQEPPLQLLLSFSIAAMASFP